MVDANPFFEPSTLEYGLPPFAEIRDEHYEPAFEKGMADQLAEVRAIVVTGAGRGFCAGADMQDLQAIGSGDIDSAERRADPRPQTFPTEIPKPVIAAVNGPAVGIGATMMCAMDIRLASEKARIGFVFGKLGIVPEAASTWFLPRIVGIPQALEWLYGADILTADEAKDGGLVRSVHAPDELLPAAYALARKFTENRSPVGIALTRQMVYRNSAQQHPVEAHKVDSLAMFWTSVADGKEGVAAFLEKRDPQFTSSASDLPEVFPS